MIQEITVGEWIIDFIKWIEQLRWVSQLEDFGISSGIWLGGLFYPGALLTATQ